MNLHEALLFFVHRAKASRGVDVAAIVRPDGTPEGIAYSRRGANAHSFKTAAVNLVKGMSEANAIGPTDYYLYTTYPPTKMCLGLAMRCHVTEAFFLDAAGRIMRNDARAVTQNAALFGGPGPNVGDWAASPDAAQWGLGHQLAKAARSDYSPQFQADYLSHIDQGLDARLTLLERDSAFAYFPPPVVHANAGGMTIGAESIFMRTAAAMVGIQNRIGIPGNNIGTLLVSKQGTILAYGINDNTGDATRHAETNCLAQWEAISNGAGIPAGSYMFTTLRSCDMCSAAITTMAAGPILVHYGEPDPQVAATTLSVQHNHCREQRSGLPLRPQAVTRWSQLASSRSALAAVARTQTVSRAGNVQYNAEAIKNARMDYRAAGHGRGVTGRLTHPAAQKYFLDQLTEPNAIPTRVAAEALTHCAEFLRWFEQNVR